MIGEDFYRVFFREREIGECDVEALRFWVSTSFAMSIRLFDELA
jgi:hypothetical protein